MNNKIFLTLLVFGTIASAQAAPRRAQPKISSADEPKLIEILRSSTATVKAKADACAKLKLIATAQAIPALAALLPDEQLSHSARFVLEPLKDQQAETALIDALKKTSGLIEVGIIDSLAVRHEPAAISPLDKLLSSQDPLVASAAANALGRIGGTKSIKALEHAAGHSTGALHAALVDGLLTDANQLLADGKNSDALPVFKKIYSTEKVEHLRIGAYRGWILASGKNATRMMSNAIAGNEPGACDAALQLASTLPGNDVTATLANLLSRESLNPLVKQSIIISLFQRRDPSAMAAVAAAVQSPDAGVRLAALIALGPLGDASVANLLAEKAATSQGAERDAARQSLLELNHGDVSKQMVALLKTVSAPEKAELLTAMANRDDKSVIPSMIELAQHGEAKDRTDALGVLGQVAGASDISQLVQLAATGKDEQSRSDAADALTAIYQRISAPTAADAAPFVAAIKSGSLETRLALLPVASGVPQADVREALRAAANDPDSSISNAAVHAIYETHDAGMLPDLLKLSAENLTLAIRGTVRLLTQDEGVKFTSAQKLAAIKQLLADPLNTASKQLVLSALGTIDDAQALPAATGMLGDAAVKPEAEQCVIRIANAISEWDPAAATAALKQVLSEATDPAIQKSAQLALKKIAPAGK